MLASPPPLAAAAVFGELLPLAQRFADWLTGPGIVRGLLGPREREHIWERHLLNGVGIASLIAPGSVVHDLGSGAGLPGIPLLLARPDLGMVLVEPKARRCEFLSEVCADLGLRVTVVRARATGDGLVRLPEGRSFESLPAADVVTARAVASTADLARWAAALLRAGGQLLAVKGASADEELERDRAVLDALGFTDLRVLHVEEVTSAISAAGETALHPRPRGELAPSGRSATPGSAGAATVVAATLGRVSRET